MRFVSILHRGISFRRIETGPRGYRYQCGTREVGTAWRHDHAKHRYSSRAGEHVTASGVRNLTLAQDALLDYFIDKAMPKILG